MSASPPPILHGGGLAAAARRYGGDVAAWLDLSTGINPNPVTVPPIPLAVWHRLPDRDLFDEARRAARDRYRTADMLPLPVPGTQSVIQLLPRLVAPGARVAVVSPTYGEYARVLTAAGLVVERIGGIDDVGHEHRLCVVVNPNNPDGRSYPRPRLAALARRMAAQGGFLVVDEAFGDGFSDLSLAPDIAALPAAIVFRSFGKFYGLAGLRLGFVIAAPQLLALFEEGLGPWAVSGPALFLARRLLGADDGAIRSAMARRHAAMASVLHRSGLRPLGGTDLFFLVAHPDAAALHVHLCQRRILTRVFDYAADWMRIGLAPGEEAEARLAEALAAWRPR